MEEAELLSGDSVNFAEEIYERYLRDPTSVDEDWRRYFDRLNGSDNGHNGSSPIVVEARAPIPVTIVEKRDQSPPGSNTIDARVPFLESLSLFKEVDRQEIARVAGIAEDIELKDKDLLFHQGDPSRDLYIVVDGTILIRRAGRMIAALGRGEVVGEMAALDNQPRSADALARGQVRLLRIRADSLNELLEQRPLLARGVIRVLSKRLRESISRQDLVDQLIRAYRVRGHLHADLNPLSPPSYKHPELDPAYYGFTPNDLDVLFSSSTIPGATAMALRDILSLLRETYCRSIGVQFMHIDDMQVKDWLQRRMESSQNRRGLSRAEQVRILTKLTDAEIFEQFIHSKFVGAKRFSLEGAESLIPLLDQAITAAAGKGVKEVVIGMAHRGRLNVLANIMNKSPKQIFREFDDTNPDRYRGSGDVKYHLGYSSDTLTAEGPIHLSLCFNPSHLQFVGPVVLGRVRAKQDRFQDHERKKGMGIIIHGDAAFAGQGVVQEMLNMSELDGYTTGGTIHVVLNNQIGFTTDPDEARSTQYATDIARMMQIPIFHVNGEHPEPVAQVIELAMDFRETWKKDIVIDMYCYRRHGHNEGDEPSFTQPLLYEKIKKKKSVREAYLDSLLKLNGVTREEADQIAVSRREALEQDLGVARSAAFATQEIAFGLGVWAPYRGGPEKDVPEVPTAVEKEKLSALLLAQTKLPDTFNPHPKLARWLKGREAMATGEAPLDWGAGEALAFATLLAAGARIRLSGQDAQRGTFSHRHAVLHDVKTGEKYIPLANLGVATQAIPEIVNSPLTEIGVLGFDYGYSLDYPDGLTIWEAQFGDFANVAQVIMDQFITSGEDKWNRLSGLVLLLPHGFEGQGPEHSSARLERFLGLAAEDNMQVVNLTTPAQIFHCLRRQVVRPWRKPLIVMSPKSLLRHPEAVSSMDELATGKFQRVIGDVAGLDAAKVRRVLITSGKLYYELVEARKTRDSKDVAIVRLEQYYPLATELLKAEVEKYPDDASVVWVQEEPLNMGAWGFLDMHLGERAFGKRPFSVIARAPSSSPATGSWAAHKKEQAELIDAAFAPG